MKRAERGQGRLGKAKLLWRGGRLEEWECDKSESEIRGEDVRRKKWSSFSGEVADWKTQWDQSESGIRGSDERCT